MNYKQKGAGLTETGGETVTLSISLYNRFLVTKLIATLDELPDVLGVHEYMVLILKHRFLEILHDIDSKENL